MATGIRNRTRPATRRHHRPTPYSLPSRRRQGLFKKPTHQKKEIIQRKQSRIIASEKKDWEDATCSVCMEYPHNAVLLLCSSHEKGCRPYMCGTSYRYSNCLDQFKKAYTKVTSPPHWHEKSEVMELACPLCRGQVKGMTVVEPAREYLNAKKRICTQDDCSFSGTYKELRKHVKQEHPFAEPRKVDPTHEQKWRSLERERERDDVLSTVMATMPGARILGDYVIERDHYGYDDSDDDDDDDDDEDEEEEADEDYGGTEVVDDPSLFNFFFMYQAWQAESSPSFQNRLRRQRALSAVGEEVAVNEAGRRRDRSERRRRRRSHRGGRSVMDVS